MKLAYLGWGALGAAGLWLLCGGRRKLALPLLTVGDSIAEGIGQAVERLAQGQALTLAQSGEGVEATASRLTARLRASAEARSVVLSTGVNSLSGASDSAVEVMRETVEVVRRIRETGREVILVGPPPAFGMDDKSDAWREQLVILERLHGRMTPRVSLFQLLGDERRVGYFDAEYGTPGGLHPNRAGYERVAAAILGR